MGLVQLKLPKKNTKQFNEVINPNLLLGKRVERFVSSELQEYTNIEILQENIQIQNQKITVGELDCILKQDNTPVHLEVVYKFYLYDSSVGKNELDHWIGPNRKDDLVKKLTKLKNKQLPLLYNNYSQPTLDNLNLKSENIEQRVLFKAQLFVPYHQSQIDFKQLNKACLSGFYINQEELDQFKACQFYIPSKANWLKDITANVDWLSYDSFSETIEPLLLEKIARLSWIKFPNGTIQKFFVVWWKFRESIKSN